MSVQVEHVDLRTAPESVLRECYELETQKRATYVPDDSAQPFKWFNGEWRAVTEYWKAEHWIATANDRIVGFAGVEMDMVQNLELADAFVFVTADYRGRGIGRALASAMFGMLEEAGRVKPIFNIPDGSELESLAKRAGLRPVLRMRRSRLLTSEIDRELMEQWVARASERAADYDILFLETPVPEAHIEGICRVNEIMNDAPFEDLDLEDELTTPPMWRELEQVLAARGDKLMHYVAVERSTGDFVGFTNLCYQSFLPEQAWVWNTGVHADHRNKGLGRLLKASMTLHVLDNYPAVERSDTHNAGTNKPMLDLNVAMGFKPLFVNVGWQGELATVRSSLGI